MSDEARNQQRRAFDAYDAVRRVFLELQLLKARCKYADEKFEKVSKWSVGQHIEHVLAVNAQALRMLAGEAKDTALAGAEPKPDTLVMLNTGLILRGETKALDSVLPRMTNHVDLAEDVERATHMVDALLALYHDIGNDERLYAHPALGGMTRVQWLRYLEIHARHHLKIIGDIVGRNG